MKSNLMTKLANTQEAAGADQALAEVLDQMRRTGRELHSRTKVMREAVSEARELVEDGKLGQALSLLRGPLADAVSGR